MANPEAPAPAAERITATETEEPGLLARVLQHRIDYVRSLGQGFAHDDGALVAAAERFAEFFGIDEAFFTTKSSVIRPVVLLAVVDEWLGTENVDERKGLMDVTKILLNEEWKGNMPVPSLGRRVLQHAENGEKLGTEFVTGFEKSRFDGMWDERLAYALRRVHRGKTRELRRDVGHDQRRGMLTRIRRRLGITEESEHSFEVVVLSVPADRLARKFDGVVAFCSGDTIYLPRDYDGDMVEHEYIHTQQHGVNFGAQRILGVGLMEAWTEHQVRRPSYYAPQRKVLRRLIRDVPDFTQTISEYSRTPSVEGLDRLYGSILVAYGPKALSSVLRMAPSTTCTTDSGSYYHGKYIFLTPRQVYGQMRAIPRQPETDRNGRFPDAFYEDDIAILEYIRSGLNDSEKVKLDHMITIARYLLGDIEAKRDAASGWQRLKAVLRERLADPKDEASGKDFLGRLVAASGSAQTAAFAEILRVLEETGPDIHRPFAVATGTLPTATELRGIGLSISDILVAKRDLAGYLFDKHPDSYLMGAEYLYLIRLTEGPALAESRDALSYYLTVWRRIQFAVQMTDATELYGTDSVLYEIDRLLALKLELLSAGDRGLLALDLSRILDVVREKAEPWRAEVTKVHIEKIKQLMTEKGQVVSETATQPEEMG